MPLQEGSQAPDFKLKRWMKHRRAFQLQGKEKRRRILLSQDDTPGCTKEACGFRDDLSQLASKDAVIFGIPR